MPAKKQKQTDAKFRLKLTVNQRKSLVHPARLTPGLNARIEETSIDQKILEFTKSELEKLEEGVYNALSYAAAVHSKRLNAVLDEVSGILADLDEKELKVRFSYEYDFGDDWQHEVLVEKTLDPGPRVAYPRCIDGTRACPPEDVGGIWGYPEFLEAIADRKHPDD